MWSSLWKQSGRWAEARSIVRRCGGILNRVSQVVVNALVAESRQKSIGPVPPFHVHSTHNETK